MKVSDLHRNELLNFSTDGGVILFGPIRVVLMDTTALGLLRKELIDGLGWNGARLVLTRFGFAHGWRTAESLREGFPWDSESEWQKAGRSLHALLGFVVGERLRGYRGLTTGVPGPWNDEPGEIHEFTGEPESNP